VSKAVKRITKTKTQLNVFMFLFSMSKIEIERNYKHTYILFTASKVVIEVYN